MVIFANRRTRFLRSLVLLLSCGLLIPALMPVQPALAAGASDDFNRADGGLGANWSGIGAGAMAISSQAAVGTLGSAVTGATLERVVVWR